MEAWEICEQTEMGKLINNVNSFLITHKQWYNLRGPHKAIESVRRALEELIKGYQEMMVE